MGITLCGGRGYGVIINDEKAQKIINQYNQGLPKKEKIEDICEIDTILEPLKFDVEFQDGKVMITCRENSKHFYPRECEFLEYWDPVVTENMKNKMENFCSKYSIKEKPNWIWWTLMR